MQSSHRDGYQASLRRSIAATTKGHNALYCGTRNHLLSRDGLSASTEIVLALRTLQRRNGRYRCTDDHDFMGEKH